MIHPIVVRLINSMPSSILKPIAKKIVATYLNRYADIKVENIAVLDAIEGPVLFVGNHLSNADGLVLDRVLRKADPAFVAGVKLSKTSLSRIGIEAVKTIQITPGTADIEAMKKCIERIKSGESVLIFPEGTRSRTGEMIEGKKGVLLIAKKCGVPIVPIGITGTEQLMPINDNNMGSEDFQHAKVTVKLGKLFVLPEKNAEENKEAYHDRCMKLIMNNIAILLPEAYRGVYR